MYFRNPLQDVISSESNVYILMNMMWFALRKNMIFKMFLILRSSQQGHFSWFPPMISIIFYVIRDRYFIQALILAVKKYNLRGNICLQA